MGVFFGTDGIRGKVNEELTFDIAYKIGNALSILKENPTARLIFAGKVAGDHAIPQGDLSELLATLAKEGHTVARLKGGDPYIFGRGGEEAQVLYQHGVPFEVVPGVTTASAGLMAAGIPATHRDHASSLHLITGHRKGEAELDFATLAKLTGTLVFYMGLNNLENLSRQLLHHGILCGHAVQTGAAVVRDHLFRLTLNTENKINKMTAKVVRRATFIISKPLA